MAKLVTGYALTVKFFVPVNMTSLDDPIAKAQAVRNAIVEKDLAALTVVGQIESVTQKFINKRVDEDAPAAGSADPEGEEGAEDAGDTEQTTEAADEEAAPQTRRARGRAAAE